MSAAQKVSNSPPTSDEVVRRFDHIIGRELSEDLFYLFESVSLNLNALIQDAHFPQIQEYMKKFLFDQGFQEIGVRIRDRGSNVHVRHESVRTPKTFPHVTGPADMDVMGQFFPSKIESYNKSQASVNEFNGFVGMCGMIPLEVVVKKLRQVIVNGSDHGNAVAYPTKMAEALLNALKKSFPNGNEFASDFIELESTELELIPSSPGGIFMTLTAELNMASLAKNYAAMANLLKHLGELDLSIIDAHDPANGTPEQDANTARCMMQVRIMNIRGSVELKVNFMLPGDDRDCLMWFDRQKKCCVLDSSKKPIEVDFGESTTSYSKTFRVVIDGTMRIPQLGCGSIALPLLIIQLKCSSSKSKFDSPYGGQTAAHRVDITIMHMTDKRLTAILLRPFFNLDLLRFILLNHFHMQLEVSPPSEPRSLAVPSKVVEFPVDEEVDVFFDAQEDENAVPAVEEFIMTHPRYPSVCISPNGERKPWTFTSKLHMYLPLPPKVITSCLSLFVGEQMASPDNLRLFKDLMKALSKDLKLMNARLAREEGDLARAALVEADLKKVAEAEALKAEELRKKKELEEAKKKKKRRFFFW